MGKCIHKSAEFNQLFTEKVTFSTRDFTDQHEAFRNALRLGQELNRTVIAPMLRLGRPLHWQSFEKLTEAYAQDKRQQQQACHNTASPATCLQRLNEWTEIPWSSLFDLEAITDEFGISIIERTSGHGWGINETAHQVKDSISDVVVLDVMTFIENATFHNSNNNNQGSKIKKLGGFLGRQFSIVNQQPRQQIDGNKPFLKTVIHAHQWPALRHRQYIQFGALSSTPRYQVHATVAQVNFRKALSHSLFVRPDQMKPLQQQADRVIETLGGADNFSTLILNLGKVIESDGRINKTQGKFAMDDLDATTQRELMDTVVLEVFGDVPINQAVSAALPVKPDSNLATVLSQQQQRTDRKQLLDACLDYRHQYEEQYPIYYLVSDHIPTPALRPDIYGPLLSHFPCLFTKDDLKQWGKLDLKSWTFALSQDQGIDGEAMLSPILDILIAGQGKSSQRRLGGAPLILTKCFTFSMLMMNRLFLF